MTVTSVKTRSIKIAVCGELNSGKTSMINSVYRAASVPDFHGVRNKPVTRVIFGAAEETTKFTDVAGNPTTVVSAEAIPTDGSISEIEISTQDSPFGACEVIEFPPLRDGHVTQAEIDRISACDVLVWMTIGSQSWRLSEKTIFDTLQKNRRMPSILVVSRADKFRSLDDQTRLNTRLDKETADRFDARVMMHADPAALDLARRDDDAWAKTGGKILADYLPDLMQRAVDVRKEPEALPKVEALSIESDESTDDGTQPNQISRRPRSTQRRGSTVARMLKSRTHETVSETNEPETVPVAKMPKELQEVSTKGLADPIENASDKVAETDGAEVSNVETKATPPHAHDEVQEIAEGLEGLLSLATIKSDMPEDVLLISGDAEQANQLAKHLVGSQKMLTDSAFFKDPEWVHITLKNHQILYRLETDKDDCLVLACRSSNSGVSRNAFMRISNMMTGKA